MNQRRLFDDDNNGDDFPPCDPTVPDEAKPRLGKQCQAILDRLREGPVNNRDLAVNYSINFVLII